MKFNFSSSYRSALELNKTKLLRPEQCDARKEPEKRLALPQPVRIHCYTWVLLSSVGNPVVTTRSDVILYNVTDGHSSEFWFTSVRICGFSGSRYLWLTALDATSR